MGLFSLFDRPAPQRPARFEEGRVGYAVGDVHGRKDLLARMIERLEARAAEEAREAGPPVVVFLGDYVDRGPDSAGVLELLLEGRPAGFERRFLKGNHEDAMLGFLDDPATGRRWMGLGGLETLAAYGVSPLPLVGADEEALAEAAQTLKERLPASHLGFLRGLERFVTLGDYLCVHAGIDPGRPLAEQRDADLFWIRKRFLDSRRCGEHRVVHGHSPVSEPYADHRRICVDTGAYYSGRLTAARFEAESVAFLGVSDRDTAA